ncbi:MAG: DNA repair protein RecN [Clostridia bacterium]|nr:DNA repair protein RecN [Clostridia bacterium]
MITTLHIKNIGIIEDLNVELSEGLNVFTGETGAGKTLIIDAINIISGGRFSKEMIRRGEKYSFVEMNLFLPEYDNSIEGNIIVSREIHTNGRNSCKINGRLVTVTELKSFMNGVIDIHGQNDNQKILNPIYHINYLDNFAGKELKILNKQYNELYCEYCSLRKKLKENLGDEKEKQRKLDLLQYEFDEIDSANLKVGEDEELKEKSKIFENAEKITLSISESSLCSQNAIDEINSAIKAVEKISHLDSKYDDKLSELKNIYYEIEEFSRDLSYMTDDVDFSEDERDEIEQRLDLIASLKRKYGSSIEEILEYKNKTEAEIDYINNLDEENSKLKKQLEILELKMGNLSGEIHKKRIDVSTILNKKVNKELSDLEMSSAKFTVNVEKTEEFNEYGKDKVQFYISTNVGEDNKELNKVVSGGEMSRIMLAIKTVLANTDSTPVMVFDEIDTGISGKAAKSVSQKLKLIGENHQVICITHQPSIAAKGDNNYFISKETINDRTHTQIKKLNENEIINEIARIANGDITEIALKHALELRKLA